MSEVEKFAYYDPMAMDCNVIPRSCGIYMIAIQDFNKLVNSNVYGTPKIKTINYNGKKLDIIYIGWSNNLRSTYIAHFSAKGAIVSNLRKYLGILLSSYFEEHAGKQPELGGKTISEWMKENLFLLYVVNEDVEIKKKLISVFHPPLNVDDNINSDFRKGLITYHGNVVVSENITNERAQADVCVQKIETKEKGNCDNKIVFEKILLFVSLGAVFVLLAVVLILNTRHATKVSDNIVAKNVVEDSFKTENQNEQIENLFVKKSENLEDEKEIKDLLVTELDGRQTETSLKEIGKTYKQIRRWEIAPGYGKGSVFLYKKGDEYLLCEYMFNGAYCGYKMKEYEVKRNNEFICHVLVDGLENMYYVDKGKKILINPNIDEAYDNNQRPYKCKMILVILKGYVAIFINDNSTFKGKNVYVEYLMLI